MIYNKLPDQEILFKFFNYNKNTGEIIRKYREDMPKEWNTRWANKPAFNVKSKDGYFSGGFMGKKYLAHRIAYKFIYGEDPEHIDHKDCNPSNNKIENLRSSTPSQNQMNVGKRRFFKKYKGVYFVKSRNKFTCLCNKKYYGMFDDEESAALAYNQAAVKEFGEFAKFNDIIQPQKENTYAC